MARISDPRYWFSSAKHAVTFLARIQKESAVSLCRKERCYTGSDCLSLETARCTIREAMHFPSIGVSRTMTSANEGAYLRSSCHFFHDSSYICNSMNMGIRGLGRSLHTTQKADKKFNKYFSHLITHRYPKLSRNIASKVQSRYMWTCRFCISSKKNIMHVGLIQNARFFKLSPGVFSTRGDSLSISAANIAGSRWEVLTKGRRRLLRPPYMRGNIQEERKEQTRGGGER